MHVSCVAEFLGSVGRDAAEVRRVGQPPQPRAADVPRREGKLRRRPPNATITRRKHGRGVLPGRGPADPHPVPAETSLPAYQPPGGLRTS